MRNTLLLRRNPGWRKFAASSRSARLNSCNAILRGVAALSRLAPTFLAVCILVFCSCIAVAQQQTPASASPSQNSSAPASRSEAAFAQSTATANQELAHVSNEAADQDETEAFKHSPAVRGIARITGLSLTAAYWICVVINFAIIAVAVVFFLKSNLPSMFRARTQSIQQGMQQARRTGEDAQRRLAEIEQRLARMSVEIEEMQKHAEAEARAEEERIRSSIEQEKHKILDAAKQEIAQAETAARRDLQKYAVSLAIEMAEKGMRVDAAEDRGLVDDFTAQLAATSRRNGSG